MDSSEALAAFARALANDPENHRLRLVYAEALAKHERFEEAAAEYELLLGAGKLSVEDLLPAGQVSLRAGRYSLASALASRARELGMVEGIAELQHAIDAALGIAGRIRVVRHEEEPSEPLEFEPENERVTFTDVGGLSDVKKAINRTIILPLQRTDLYERFGRKSGGGVLLYGPPGCGKTLLARATAGECQLPFMNIRIEEILDPYFGLSERNLHDAFERARAVSPCVLFIDELDTIGFARRKLAGSAGRPLVNQLLQELDAIGADNDGILVLAATNAPWDVDSALKRPGRFDRSLFVPPPDQEAREAILTVQLRDLPTEKIDVSRIAKQAPLFSGADLRAVVERAVDLAIDETLASGTDQLLSARHLQSALDHMQPTTLDWIVTARRYVEFANDTGRYDDVERFLSRKDVKLGKT
jgi:transitional endoplasmic reticulum ATPase